MMSGTNTAALATAPVARRRARSRKADYRFQLIRCVDPNRSIARISELKTKGLSNYRNTLFQLKDVLDNAVLSALLDLFRYFVAEGIRWRTLDLHEMRNINNASRYNPSLLRELLQVANESNLFQNVQLTMNGSTGNNNFAMIGADPPNIVLSILPSIEQNTRLLKLCIDLKGRLSDEDVQSLVTLLKDAKKLKRLEINCHGFRIEELSEGFAENSTLLSLSLTTQSNSMMTGSSSIRAMMVELSKHSSLKLKKLALSGASDGELSTPLESLLLSQKGRLKNVNLQCHATNFGISFPDPNAAPGTARRGPTATPRGSSPFDSFFRRLANIAPPNSSVVATTLPSTSTSTGTRSDDDDQMEVDGTEQDQQHQPTLDEYLSQQGPLITIETNLYSTTKEQIATVQKALVNYPRLRLSGVQHPPAELGYFNLLNHCGRYLMYRPDTPLGIWPVALERAACLESHKRQRSSIIYELLHGGVFAARETYASI